MLQTSVRYTAADRIRDIIEDNGLLLPVLNRFRVPFGFGNSTVDDICKENDITRVRDKNFIFFNQAKDIEYWAACQGRLIYLYRLELIPEDKLPA